MVDTAPEGWAGRVLESGRALLLVDGLDEVPPEDREQAHTWLTQLLARYPDTRCVATVRPLAVEPDWLRSEGFAELRLLPMRNEDIQAFVASWHRAALLSELDGHDRLDELEHDLSRQFDQNATLRDLARTPLLCAVICALHRRRDGFLPETRWKLYSSALDMLLGHRDRRRRIGGPEGIELEVEEHTQLLQRIAVWLVREGQSEFTRGQALRQLGRALAGMERVSAQGPPERILTHLLNRSGLLQERRDDTYQFIHRTFQDYLAAKELIEDEHLNELLRHADEEYWQDVILLAAGHCGRRELAVLVDGLLDAGLKHPEGSAERSTLHVLAALCEQHATWLDGAVRDRVRHSTASLFPPADADQAAVLSRLGAAALDHLPEPESVPAGSPAAHHVSRLLLNVGGAEAIRHVRAWLAAHPALFSDFTTLWSVFPPEPYAREVLAHHDLSQRYVLVDRGRLGALRHLPSLGRLILFGDLTDDELRTALAGTRLSHLRLHANTLFADVSLLGSQADTLRHLGLVQCPAIEDLTPLGALPSLTDLSVDLGQRSAGLLAPVAGMSDLIYLNVRGLDPAAWDELPVLPGLAQLCVSGDQPLSVRGLGAWESLTGLRVSEVASLGDVLAELRANPRITLFELESFPFTASDALEPVPSVEDLEVDAFQDAGQADLLRRLFPGLTALTLNVPTDTAELDLTPLLSWTGLQVTVYGGFDTVLVGGDALGDRLHVHI